MFAKILSFSSLLAAVLASAGLPYPWNNTATTCLETCVYPTNATLPNCLACGCLTPGPRCLDPSSPDNNEGNLCQMVSTNCATNVDDLAWGRVCCESHYPPCTGNGTSGGPIKHLCYSSCIAALVLDSYLECGAGLDEGFLLDSTPPDCYEESFADLHDCPFISAAPTTVVLSFAAVAFSFLICIGVA